MSEDTLVVDPSAPNLPILQPSDATIARFTADVTAAGFRLSDPETFEFEGHLYTGPGVVAFHPPGANEIKWSTMVDTRCHFTAPNTYFIFPLDFPIG